MKTAWMLVLGLFGSQIAVGAPNNDEKAIRAAWTKIERSYERGDLKGVESTFAPKFYALMNHLLTDRPHVIVALEQRFQLQTQCQRRMKISSLKVAGNRAYLDMEGQDEYSYRRDGGIRHEVQRRRERSEWVRVDGKWKQDHVRIVRYEWRLPNGTWKDAMPQD